MKKLNLVPQGLEMGVRERQGTRSVAANVLCILANHLIYLMGSVHVRGAAVKSPGLIRSWWLIQEVSVQCKAMRDPPALGLLCQRRCKTKVLGVCGHGVLLWS